MSAHPLEGKWLGGPHNSIITIVVRSLVEIDGSYKCPSGGIGEFTGKIIRGTCARCLWVDPEVSGAQKRSIEQVLEIQLDISGDSWTGTARTAGGGVSTWKATRVKPKQRQRGEKLSTEGVFKNKDIFKRLTESKSDRNLVETLVRMTGCPLVIVCVGDFVRVLFTTTATNVFRNQHDKYERWCEVVCVATKWHAVGYAAAVCQ